MSIIWKGPSHFCLLPHIIINDSSDSFYKCQLMTQCFMRPHTSLHHLPLLHTLIIQSFWWIVNVMCFFMPGEPWLLIFGSFWATKYNMVYLSQSKVMVSVCAPDVMVFWLLSSCVKLLGMPDYQVLDKEILVHTVGKYVFADLDINI